MEIRNLGKNILFRICQELAQQDRCEAIETDFVYQTFADIPGETIDESLHWLVQQGWLHKNDTTARVILTEEGRAAINNMIPESLRKDCIKPMACHLPW